MGIPQPPGGVLPPAEIEPVEPGAAPPDIAAAADEAPFEPVTLPVIVVPPALAVPPGGAGGGAAVRVPGGPEAPKSIITAPRAGVPPAPEALNNAVPAGFRIGYVDYLRTAGTAEIAALAIPGSAGLIALTGLGGLVGYRQAKAGRATRTESIARFLN